MIIVKGGELFSPKSEGRCDILVGGGSILAVEPDIDPKRIPGEVRVLEAAGHIVVPGFIDGHQHFTGGGGEGGFETRTPEMTLSMNVAGGVTTAVGLLGTDSLTRSVESLYAKTQAFNAEGITAYMLTGAYWLPSPTLTGTVGRDITFIDPVIGVKLAMADQRGPYYDAADLAALASDARVASLVAKKPGHITVHTGINPDRLDLIFETVAKHHIRPDIFIPTHINRKNSEISAQALKLAQMGAFIDATCLAELVDDDHHLSAADFAMDALGLGLFERVCFSSDAGGSLPKWNEDRSRIVGMGIGTPASLGFELRRLVKTHGMDLSTALLPLTLTPARAYGLEGKKGRIEPGAHADLLILDAETLAIETVMAKGQIMMENGDLKKKGYFE